MWGRLTKSLFCLNSLVIHQVKQRKSQPRRRFQYPVLISIDFDDFISPFTPQFLCLKKRYIKHSRQCFITYPNTSNFVKNNPLLVVFSTLFSLFGYPDETMFLVFDKLLLTFSIQTQETIFRLDWEAYTSGKKSLKKPYH